MATLDPTAATNYDINVTGEYNVLNDCKYIRNMDRCIHDSNVGYEVIFSHGKQGWDTFSSCDMMYAQHFLWGASTGSSPLVSRSSGFDFTFEADYFSDLEIDMLIKYDSFFVGQDFDELTAKLQWRMVSDGYTWRDDASAEFTVYPDGVWHRYSVNLLEERYWVGDCYDLRLYPFIDGVAGIEIFLRRIAFTSDTYYRCTYPPCAYHRSYTHPCPAIGKYAKAYSDIRKTRPQISDDACRIGVSLDGYPTKYIDLDLANCTDPHSIAQSITLKLNTLSLGGYKFAVCEYDEVHQNFTIYTGTRGAGGSVTITRPAEKDATVELGFFDDSGNKRWYSAVGEDPADGFSAAYYKLPATILYRLPNSETVSIDYDPSDPLVEIGRNDLLELPSELVFEEGKIEGMLLVDIFGRCTYDGTINTVQFRGSIVGTKSKLLLLRPTGDYSFKIKYITNLSSSDNKGGNYYEKTVDWDVRPGDVFGLYMCQHAIHSEADYKARTEQIYKSSWIETRLWNIAVNQTVNFDYTNVKFYGYESLPVYGFSSDRMVSIGIESELRYEYGISQVALIGDSDSDAVDINLAELEGTKVQVKSAEGNTSLVSMPDADLMLDFLDTTEQFYIDIWFPSFFYDVYRIKTFFEDSLNLRAFCWEGYVEDDLINIAMLRWGEYYSFPTDALSVGSERPWMRLVSPYSVYTNGHTDRSQNDYLKWNYVTNDPDDWYPSLTEDEALDRMYEADYIRWNSLEQYWDSFHTRAVRLNCWRWSSARIRKIEVWSQLSSTHTLLHAVDAVGISGPEVFSTESYNVVDLYGDLFETSMISRHETTDYLYGLWFSLQDSDTALAPVGTTLRKIRLEVSGLRARIKQVKLIPQKLAVQVRDETGDPLTEITNLKWGSPSDGSSFTYGPPQKYTVHNDTGFKANLILGLANALDIDYACVFSSTLTSQASIDDPYRGMAATLIKSDDYHFTNHRSINYHAKAYTVAPEDPLEWYSSSTDGEVWQTLTSGNPFYTAIRWNEPNNPNNPDWYLFNTAKAENVSISGGSLSIDLLSRTYDATGGVWDNVTYFRNVRLNDTLQTEVQIPAAVQQKAGVDVSAGLVLFDNTDRTKYIRIGRYSGNSLNTVSGVADLIDHPVVPHGDYISYGRKYDFSPSGTIPLIPIMHPEQPVVVNINKEATSVRIGWRYSQLTPKFTTVSSFDISDWSDQLRLGVFGEAYDVSGYSPYIRVSTAVDYLSQRYEDVRKIDWFDYSVDLDNTTTTSGRWTALNSNEAEIMRSGPEGIHIKRYLKTGSSVFFDNPVTTPALSTDWGAPTDYSNIGMRVYNFSEDMLASGVFSAGFLVRDKGNSDNYVKYAVGGTDQLRIDATGQSTDWFTVSGSITSASGIWLKLRKGGGVMVPSYSRDGSNYTTISGISIRDWTTNSGTDLILSSDLWQTKFTDVDLGASRVGATHLAAKFRDNVPIRNIYGRQVEWYGLEYSDSDLYTWQSSKPATVKYIKMNKPYAYKLDLSKIKFIPDVTTAVAQDYNLVAIEIPHANERLYDRAGEPRADIGLTNQEDWPSGAAFQGIPMYDMPTLVFDLGRPYDIGRCSYVIDKANGEFSDTDVNTLINVEWNQEPCGLSGFDQKCLLSANDVCTVSTEWKPKQLYDRYGEIPGYYYPGACNGVQTTAGRVVRACPWYSRTKARWWLLESTDYTTTTATSGTVWNIPAVRLHPTGYPVYLTDDPDWWSTDYGQIDWVYRTDSQEYALVYSYPGLNIQGSMYFNGYGSAWWRLDSDREWTHGDTFSVDLNIQNPDNINQIKFKLGRDPKCYWELTVTGSLATGWSTYELPYTDATPVVDRIIGMDEPSYTPNDIEFYEVGDLPYSPLPFLNLGYVEMTVSGSGYSDVYVKNLTNKRTHFTDNGLFLGLNESLYLPDLDITNTGTVEFYYHPDEAAMDLIRGDPREFVYSVLTVSNQNSGLAVVLNKQWGWNIYAFTPRDQQLFGFLPTLEEAKRTIPLKESGRKSGPFHVILSWSPNNLPGMEYNVALWIDSVLVCYGSVTSLKDYFDSDDVEVTLGRGSTVFDPSNQDQYAAYATFKNLKIYKHAIGTPSVDIDDENIIPENMFELSLDGSDWKSFANGELPIHVQGVENGDSVTFWMRNKRPSYSVKKLHKRHTAQLQANWEIMGT